MSGSVRRQLVAAGEVAGRHAVRRLPRLRRRIGRWARRPRREPPPLALTDLAGRLATLGVAAGRPLLVHASWDGLRQVRAKPSAVVALLGELVGRDGTLLMPSHPALEAHEGLPLYDVDRSPSTAGLLSETLRRTAGALRGPCPVAPVCALGADAEAFTGDFRAESAATAYGRGSPYWRVAEGGGQVLVLGVDLIRSLTLMHVAFDLLADDNPIADYYRTVAYRVRRGGREERWQVKTQRGDLEAHFASAAFRDLVLGSGTVATDRRGGLDLALVDAAAFLAWHLPLARAEGWPYWGFRRRRAGGSR